MDGLLPLVYDELRRFAAQKMAQESAPIEADQLLAVNEALERFTARDPIKAQLVKLRYFVGLTIEEAAQTPGISEPTAKR